MTQEERNIALARIERCKHLTSRCKHIKKKYGVPMGTYYNLFKLQNEACAICETPATELKKDLAIDHCHKTGTVRGLLCQECNLGLGKFKDNVSALEKAIKYLKGET